MDVTTGRPIEQLDLRPSNPEASLSWRVGKNSQEFGAFRIPGRGISWLGAG
jgi:hypothetical protein